MNAQNIWNDANLVKVLQDGSVAVMPTDTVYGIVGRADNESTVKRIYEIRKRNLEKPCIILISEMNELENFSIHLTEAQKNKIKEFWPGPVSIILDCQNEAFLYLHRGTNTLAFRLPQDDNLRELLKQTGPLIAPSANPEGEPTAKNITEARNYFNGEVDLYIDGGEILGKSSTIVRLFNTGDATIMRK